jgi:hypothetical protein
MRGFIPSLHGGSKMDVFSYKTGQFLFSTKISHLAPLPVERRVLKTSFTVCLSKRFVHYFIIAVFFIVPRASGSRIPFRGCGIHRIMVKILHQIVKDLWAFHLRNMTGIEFYNAIFP